MLTHSALRLLRRLLGASPRAEGPYAGSATVMDGTTAVAVTEAGVSEVAGLGATFPADAAGLAWRAEQHRHGTNLAGAPLSSQAAEGPRGALAAAMGLALSGVRAACFLSGPDLAAARDLLQAAAGRRLPLVIHVVARALPGQGPAMGGGHEAVHLAAETGCFALVAANVQEAVDFALIARRVAEQALTPGLVIMDGEQTAMAPQDVRLPPPELVKRFSGGPGDEIPAPTTAQRLLFGETRRRLPRWHDLDRPVLLGALQPMEVWGLGRAAGAVFFDAHVGPALEQAFADFAAQTGRTHRAVSAHRLDDAKLVLVALGAAVETAEAVADHLRAYQRMKVGVLGLRCLRPFPGAEIARLLGTGARVCVLERLDTPLAADPPLLRELRAALDRALESGRYGEDIHPGYPALREQHRPRLQSVIYGLGGLPLRAADLAALCRDAQSIERARVYLGLTFAIASSPYPKRQVLLDRLRRDYPDIAGLGLRSDEPRPDLRPEGAVTLALHRLSGGPDEGLAAESAALLHRLLGGGLRSRPGLPAAVWGDPCVDLISAGAQAIKDPGDAPVVDLALVTADPSLPGFDFREELGQGSALLVQSALPDDALWAHLPDALREVVTATGCSLYRVPPPEGPAAAYNDHLLGALCAVLRDTGRLDLTPRRLLSVREDLLAGADAAEQRLDAFRASLDAVHRIAPTALPDRPTPATATDEDEAPAVVRRLGIIDDAYDSLPRFWDQVGVLYRNGDTRELVPDPYLALGAVPPLSAGLRDLSRVRDRLPAFDPTLCTGCGDCWTGCPDNALVAVALTPRRLIDAGMEAAGAHALRPVATALAAGMINLCREAPAEAGRTTATELIAAAYDRIKAGLPFPDERKALISQGLEAVKSAIGCLPLAVATPFFGTGGAKGEGGEELLALALDPDACKGCGICEHACTPGALRMQRQHAGMLTQARHVRRAWDLLPDTEGDTIRRVRANPEVGTAAGALLARTAGQSLAGGDGVEPGSGAKLALRLALATAESLQAPQIAAYAQEARAAGEQIRALIRGLLTDALPADDLDALSRSLEGAGPRTDLGAFIGQAEQSIDRAVDAPRLRRLVTLARGLGDLAWKLSAGRQGIGRARAGLVLAPGGTLAFPDNPCAVPVVLDPTGDGAQLAAGLIEGQLRQAVEGLVLLRKARLELEHPDDAARRWSELDALSWRDLGAEERTRCPALLLVGEGGVLAGRGLAQVVWLLGTDLPVKLLVLADLDLGLAAPAELESSIAGVADATANLGLLALSQRGAFIAQSALGAPEHLMESLEQALRHQGPALVQVHAPSPARHGFAAERTLERAREAVAARVLPLFRYHPEGEGVFGSRFDLDGNPDPLQPWAGNGETGFVTAAHWALGEGRFAGLFAPLKEEEPAPTALADYLAMSPNERRKRTPFVERGGNGSEPRRLRVDERLVKVSQERLDAWRMLQELAGLVTPFTARVERQAAERVAAGHQAELAAQAQDYEARLRGLRDELQEETRREMRERLMQLAGYRDASPRQERAN